LGRWLDEANRVSTFRPADGEEEVND